MATCKINFWCAFGWRTVFLSCCVCVVLPAPRGSLPSHSLPFRLCRHAGPMPADVMETVVLAGVIHVRTATPTQKRAFF